MGQVREEPPTGAGWEMLLLQGTPTNHFLGPGLGKGTPNTPNMRTNSIPGRSGKLPPTALRLRPLGTAGGSQVQPGIYETEPYTCIVVVPRAHPDDKMIVGQGRPTGTNVFVPRMPMVQPELRFIPRGNR